MDLLLTHGYFLAEDPKEQRIMKPYPPLGILYLSSHLRREGFDVEVYDSTFGSRGGLLKLLESEQPSVLGVYANLLTRGEVVRIAQDAKARGWFVVLGGPEPANYAAEYLDAGADVIVRGEGERAMAALLARLKSGGTLSEDLPSLIYRAADGLLVNTPAAPLIENLDGQPWPDREQIDIERYVHTWRERHGRGSLSVITARGCPYHCRWCSHSVYGKTHRRRSATNVVDEVEFLLDRYEPDMLWIADDVFTIHHGWLAAYAGEMRRRGLKVPFECITRADRVNERVAGMLAELGCLRVWIGSESGSQRILDAMQRGVTVEQVQRAVELCRASGIETGMFIMWGYEGEQMEDVEATVAHVRKCQPEVCLTTVSYPIKGTPYHDQIASKLVNIGGWQESTDRDIAVHGRHSRRFYQFADALLKAETAPVHDDALIAAAREGLAASMHEVEV
ncbi:MAG TPA: radical SAM protein [Bryobacteraceae bacterium]|nr:radical SAM protein [Bryobacteraceae bacterium]